ADSRHRCWRKERDLPAADRPGRAGQGHHRDLLRASGAPAAQPSHRGDVRGPVDGRPARRPEHEPGADHASRHAAQAGHGAGGPDTGRRNRMSTAEAARQPGAAARLFKSGAHQKLLAFASLIVLLIGFSLASPNFMQMSNIIAILQATSVNGVLAVAATLVIITGGIDLSVGTLMTFCAVIAGVVLTYWGLPL